MGRFMRYRLAGTPSQKKENKKETAKTCSPFYVCARHGTNLASESLVTGIYRQV